MTAFRILSIDGGGIKGFYSAKILSLIEGVLRQERGDDVRIVDHTDLKMLTEAGFRNVKVVDTPRPQNCIFVCTH